MTFGRLQSPRIVLTLWLSLAAGAPVALVAEDAPPAQTAARPSKAEEALREIQIEHFPKKGDSGGTSWSTGAYSYDSAGNVTAIGNEYFLYDTRSRLKTAHVTSPSGSIDQTFTYDPYGNLIETNTAGAIAPTPAELATNHITTPAAQYDDAGNLKQFWSHGDTLTYGYDGMSMLTHLTDDHGASVAYVYTADDERIWTFDLTANVSHWKIRDLKGRVLRDFSQTGLTWGLSRDYFYREQALLAAALPSGVTEHFSLDHLGTPRLITDQNHNKIGFHTYFPYGTEWFGAGQQEGSLETLKFTGHERDTDPTGSGDNLDYMHARYYAPGSERFVTVDKDQWWQLQFGSESDEDRFEEMLTQPQNWNRYSYVHDNPMTFTDPTGNSDCKVNGKLIQCRIVVVYDTKTNKGMLYLIGKVGKKEEILLKGKVVVGEAGKTPTGKFHASRWEKDHTSKLYGSQADTPWSKSKLGLNAFGPFQLHIKELESRGIWIHGTMGPGWIGSSNLNYFVSPASHGCVRCANPTIISLHEKMPDPKGNQILISNDPKDAPPDP